MPDKVIKDGMVAVLYSPGYGAGWYSWNKQYKECLFDPDIVALVQSREVDEDMPSKEYNKVTDAIEKLASQKWPDMYVGGADTLTIEWIEQNALFRVHEYDGAEHIEIVSLDNDYIIA